MCTPNNVIHLEMLGHSRQRVTGRGSAPMSLGDALEAAIRRVRLLQFHAELEGSDVLATKAETAIFLLES